MSLDRELELKPGVARIVRDPGRNRRSERLERLADLADPGLLERPPGCPHERLAHHLVARGEVVGREPVRHARLGGDGTVPDGVEPVPCRDADERPQKRLSALAARDPARGGASWIRVPRHEGRG